MKSKTELNNIANQKQNFNFNQTIEELLFYFKKTFLLNGLVVLIISLIIIIPLFYLMGTSGFFNENADPEEIEKLMSDKTFLLYFSLASIFISVLMAPITAGLIQINRDIDTESEVSISNIFKHYKSKHYIQLVVFTIVFQIINLVLAQGTTLFGMPFLGNILSILLSLFTILSIPLIIFNNFNAIDALVYSFKLASKNILNIFVILITAYLIALAGFLAFCIGIFFTMPIIYSAQFVLYKNIVGFKDEIEFDLDKEETN